MLICFCRDSRNFYLNQIGERQLQWEHGGKRSCDWDAEFDSEAGCEEEPLSDSGDHHFYQHVQLDLLELR